MITSDEWRNLKVGSIFYRVDKQSKSIMKLTIDRFSFGGYLVAITDERKMLSIPRTSNNVFGTMKRANNYLKQLEQEDGN